VGLERGPLSLVRTTEELLEIKNSGSGRGSVTLTTWHNISTKVVTDLADSPRSLGIVRSRTLATEFSLVSYATGFIWFRSL
jgi:hypothetical protein